MLNGDEIRPNERDVINLPESPDNSSVVDARNEDGQKVGEQVGLLLEVEGNRLIVAGNHV
jgi:hypothetical protein